MAVSKRLRYEILRRDNYRCRYCGASAPDATLTVDHVTPVALGGTDHPSNLAASCEPCNSGKTSSTPDATLVADVSDDALRWAAAMTQAAENLREQEKPKNEYRDAFLAEWNRWNLGKDDTKKVPLDDNWKQSIERFRVAGVPAWMWADIVDTGMANEKVKPENTFRYCCGIAWNKAGAIQAQARKLLGAAPEIIESTIDTDDPDALLVEAALLYWGQDWACTFKAGPSPEQVDQFRSSAAAVLTGGRKPSELLEGAEYAVMFREADAAEGLAHRDHNVEFTKQYVANSMFMNAWFYAYGQLPSHPILDEVDEEIETLYEAGAHPEHVAMAAVVAGIHGNTRLYAGLSSEHLQAIKADAGLRNAENLWATAWRYTSPDSCWPSEEDRATFRASVSGVGASRKLFYSDLYSAAVRAGTYQDRALEPHLDSMGSTLSAASLLEGGDL